jgi:hypothetical protein
MEKTHFTVAEDDRVITRITGKITEADVDNWFQHFEQVRQTVIKKYRHFKLLVDTRGYEPALYTVHKKWRNTLYDEFVVKECSVVSSVHHDQVKREMLQKGASSSFSQYFYEYNEA